MDALDAAALRHLASPPAIQPALVDTFRGAGHVVVRGLLDPAVVEAARVALLGAIERSGRRQRPPQASDSAYERAFIQLVNAGVAEPRVRALTHAPRIGGWIAALSGASGARVMLEDTFLKLAGGGATPWHQDSSVAPVDPERVVTAWIAMQRIRPEMGGLRLVTGSHRLGLCGPVDISEQTQVEFDALIERNGLQVHELDVMEPGDVAFHSGFTIHGSRPNSSSEERLAIAVHCFADGARVAPIRHPQQARLLEELAPGLKPGDRAHSPLWPRTYGEGVA